MQPLSAASVRASELKSAGTLQGSARAALESLFSLKSLEENAVAAECGALFAFLSSFHTHTHSLSLVLVVMMKSKELKTKISHAHSLILSLILWHPRGWWMCRVPGLEIGL